jgi:hypothetical protein
MPPKWSLGYQQCRWSYLSDQRVLEVLNATPSLNSDEPGINSICICRKLVLEMLKHVFQVLSAVDSGFYTFPFVICLDKSERESF